MKLNRFFIYLSLLFSLSSHAILEVNVIKDKEDAFPIIVAPFDLIGTFEKPVDLAGIIRNNLNRSGQFNAKNIAQKIDGTLDFNFYKENKQDAIVFGKIRQVSAKVYHGEVYVYDVLTQKPLLSKKIQFTDGGLRRIAHILSDEIYYSLLGQKGSFDTRLSYVTVTENSNGGKTYRLQISDYDGYNPQTLVIQPSPILSPAWSKDQRKLAYVSFKNGRSEVFVKNTRVKTNAIKLPRFDGIASSPTWHPEGDSIALTISKNGNKDIYLYDLKTKELERLTNNISIDTEASFSPDGNKIAFTSNRTGQVQVYIKDLKTGKISRATFEGRYNAKPVFSVSYTHLTLPTILRV